MKDLPAHIGPITREQLTNKIAEVQTKLRQTGLPPLPDSVICVIIAEGILLGAEATTKKMVAKLNVTLDGILEKHEQV